MESKFIESMISETFLREHHLPEHLFEPPKKFSTKGEFYDEIKEKKKLANKLIKSRLSKELLWSITPLLLIVIAYMTKLSSTYFTLFAFCAFFLYIDSSYSCFKMASARKYFVESILKTHLINFEVLNLCGLIDDKEQIPPKTLLTEVADTIKWVSKFYENL